MKRRFDDLMVAFSSQKGDQRFLAYALCRGDARRLIAQGVGVAEHEVFVQRFAQADAWVEEADLEGFALQQGFSLVRSGEAQATRPRTDRVDDELQLQQEALENWPGIEVLGVRQLEGVVQVHMLFNGKRHAFWLPDAGEVIVSPVDRDAWLSFCQRGAPSGELAL